MSDALSIVLSLGGLLGMAACIVLMFSRAEYSHTRPWAGLQKRARTRKDGSTYVQTYYSKGPAQTKATLPKGPQIAFWPFFVAFCVGLFMG